MNDLLTEAQRAEIDRRVHNGALVFDQYDPRCWAAMLYRYRDVLDVGSIYDCPLGILFGGYQAGLDTLGLKPADAALLGFTIIAGDGLDDGCSHGVAWDNAAWEAVTAAWRREAAQRVAAAPA